MSVDKCEKSGCTLLKCPLMAWADVEKTAKLAAVVNAVFLVLFLEVPVVEYLATYGALAAIVGGAALKFSGKLAEGAELSLQGLSGLSEECFAGAGKTAFAGLNCAFNRAAPVVFWQDAQKSASVFITVYFATSVFALIAPLTLAVSVFNLFLAYGKFNKEVDAFLAPHLEQLKLKLVELKKVVPAYAGKQE